MSWDFNQRVQAAVYWLVTGSIKEVSALTDIPERTLRHWMQQVWWSQILERAKDIKNQELDSIWTQILHATTERLKDRIINGDIKIIKKGEEYKEQRVPLSATQLSVIAGIAADKREKVRINKTNIVKELDPQKITDIVDELESIGLNEEKPTQLNS